MSILLSCCSISATNWLWELCLVLKWNKQIKKCETTLYFSFFFVGYFILVVLHLFITNGHPYCGSAQGNALIILTISLEFWHLFSWRISVTAGSDLHCGNSKEKRQYKIIIIKNTYSFQHNFFHALIKMQTHTALVLAALQKWSCVHNFFYISIT